MKKTKPSEPHQPDDKLFKRLLSDPQNAIEYLRTFHPKYGEILDLNSLELVTDTLLSDELRLFSADVICRVRMKDRKDKVTVCFLFENKSKPERHISVQVGTYLYLRYYTMVRNKQPLEPIIPLYFYNGKVNWRPKTIHDLFKKHVLFDTVRPYLPSFAFDFTNVSKIPKEEIEAIRPLFMRAGMIAMKGKHRKELLESIFPLIFGESPLQKGERVSLAEYYAYASAKSREQIREQINNYVNEKGMRAKNFFEELIEEGYEKGRIRERLFLNVLSDIDFGLIYFSDFAVFDTARLAKVKNRPKIFYDKVKKGFLNGKRKEAENEMQELLTELEPLNRQEKLTVKKLIDKHLPNFQKKQN